MKKRLVRLGLFVIFIPLCISCPGSGRARGTVPPEIQLDLPPGREPPALQIIRYKNQENGSALAPWLRSFLESGIAGPESLVSYQGSYLFIASARNQRQPVITQWIENYSPDREFSRLAAERIQDRLGKDLPGKPPDIVYGSNYERAIKAAYGTTFWGSRRIDDSWVLGVSAVQNGDEPNQPVYWGFILISIPRDTLEIQISDLLSKISGSGRGRTAREQNAAFDQVREHFFEQF